MQKKKLLSFLLSLTFIASCIPANISFAESNKRQRTAYIHAQGATPTETTDVSTVYTDQNTDIYFAVDDPNKGDYENGEHKEPQYDMNGYTITVYFDPTYFDYAADNSAAPIDYTVPDKNLGTSESGSENTGSGTVDVPTETGYYAYRHGSGSEVINGKTYKSAYLTVFYNGGYVPQKKDGTLWYNLCKLPLKPLRTGSTQVFFDTSGEENKSLELFAKNTTDELNEQTFNYTAVNGGYHTIVIKDKTRPSAPTASPAEGSYTEAQTVTLTAEDNCDIYYSTDGINFDRYTSPITVDITTTITCYAQRQSDGKQSNTVKFTYNILPKSPFMFVDKGSGKQAISNIYNDDDKFTVYVSDKPDYGQIEDGSEIYYTFSNASEDDVKDPSKIGTNPETEWVKLDKQTQSIDITKKTTVRLITQKLEEYSSVSEYHLGIKPAAPTADKASGEYTEKIDITLSTKTTDAEIYYTLDGTDPVTNGILYNGIITLAKDTTLRAVSKYDGIYSELSSYYYIFTNVDDFGVDAFYPSGVYEGNVNVTLTPNNPDNDIKYSTDGGKTWIDYDKTLVIDTDTDILAKAGKGDNWGETYTFTYKIKPLPPHFAPESTQFTNSSVVSVYCPESTKDNTERFTLYYTLDNSDPVTSGTRIKADEALDSVEIAITKYTVIKAVVLKDDKTYSSVVTNSYDIVTKKPTKPLVTLPVGNYTRKIGDEKGFETQFMPVVGGTEIYYTISYDGSFTADPIPNTTGTIKYDGNPIPIKGHTIIKAVAVNVFGIKSDVGIFEYMVTPEAPKAAPSATISGDRLPVVPVSAVKGSTVKYEINGFKNEFVCNDGEFYIDTQTGNAYTDRECTSSNLLGNANTGNLTSPAKLTIKSELDGIESPDNVYIYKLSNDPNTLAQPYADKDTGEYEEAKVDDDNNLLHIKLYSLNSVDTIQYRLNNSQNWINYDGNAIKIKNDTILQTRSVKNGNYSSTKSYVYHFVPLAPVITLESGRYVLSTNPETQIEYDSRAPKDKIDNDEYRIWYRENGDSKDVRYSLGTTRSIDHTMSFKAYVKNDTTGRVSKNTIHYYIIESESSANGSVYVANPYDVSRISAAVLGTGEYAKGIKLLTQNKNATIHYFYSYTLKGSDDSITTNNLEYNNIPITVNPLMSSITITAWLQDSNGKIENSDFTHKIEFVHLEIPKTSLGSEKVVFPKNTTYTILNDYPDDENILLYYTTDGSDPSIESNENRKLYNGETLTLTGPVTIKAVYMSACGKCKVDDKALCLNKVYGQVGEYKYATPTTISTGGGGGGGGSHTVDNTRKYTKDIFGVEHPTHISYINGYPDGSVQPEGKITREEMTSVLYRITNHEYESPFAETGKVFSDVKTNRWSAHDIEYMADKKIVKGYPDGEFKPENNLSRAEFAALIFRFARLEEADTENPFNDLEEDHWSYDNILSLVKSGLVEGYEDGTFKPENEISRAEAMTVINKLLGRCPSETYVKSLEFNPYTDLVKDKWYYTAVLEATITHDYYLSDKGVEIRWENCK